MENPPESPDDSRCLSAHSSEALTGTRCTPQFTVLSELYEVRKTPPSLSSWQRYSQVQLTPRNPEIHVKNQFICRTLVVILIMYYKGQSNKQKLSRVCHPFHSLGKKTRRQQNFPQFHNRSIIIAI